MAAPPTAAPGSGSTGKDAMCVCGASAAVSCSVCATPVCDSHRDAVANQSLLGVRLADPSELAVWEWATTLDRDSLCRIERRTDVVDRCTSCRARHATNAVTAVRALPGEDGQLTRQVAAVRTGWDVDGLFAEPRAGLGPAAAAWLSTHRVRTSSIIAGWVHRGPTAVRPYSLTSIVDAWVLADSDTECSWVITPHGRIGLATRQGDFIGKPLYGAPTHAAGSVVTYELGWGASINRATKRVATALAHLRDVPVDPGPATATGPASATGVSAPRPARPSPRPS